MVNCNPSLYFKLWVENRTNWWCCSSSCRCVLSYMGRCYLTNLKVFRAEKVNYQIIGGVRRLRRGKSQLWNYSFWGSLPAEDKQKIGQIDHYQSMQCGGWGGWSVVSERDIISSRLLSQLTTFPYKYSILSCPWLRSELEKETMCSQCYQTYNVMILSILPCHVNPCHVKVCHGSLLSRGLNQI